MGIGLNNGAGPLHLHQQLKLLLHLILHIISLRELLNSKRILRYRSLIKEKANFWGEDLISENQDNITVTENIFDTRTQEIVESVLDENSTEVVTTIAWYVARS